MIRILSLCVGLCGAGLLSQYPEFAQQYMQRLAGQVDALSVVVADFDQSALDAGLTRAQALAQLTGTEFLVARQADMQNTFTRHTHLTAARDALQSATAIERVMLFYRLNDPEMLRDTWSDFKPAVPVSTAGAVTALAGFVMGWLGIISLLSLLALPFRWKRQPAQPQSPIRRDPPVTRSYDHTMQTPRLMGETRP